MSTVPVWSGREVRALRAARRMSVRDFAAHLGISDRMVSKWEAGGDAIRPRPLNQAALDTSLSMASADVNARFHPIAVRRSIDSRRSGGDPGFVRHLVRHPVDGKLMTLVDAGPFRRSRPPADLAAAFYIDVYAMTRAEYERFRAATAGTDRGHLDIGAWLDGELGPPRATPNRSYPSARMRNERRRPGRKDITAPPDRGQPRGGGCLRDVGRQMAADGGRMGPGPPEPARRHQPPAWLSGAPARSGWYGGAGPARPTGSRCSTPLARMLTLLAI